MPYDFAYTSFQQTVELAAPQTPTVLFFPISALLKSRHMVKGQHLYGVHANRLFIEAVCLNCMGEQGLHCKI